MYRLNGWSPGRWLVWLRAAVLALVPVLLLGSSCAPATVHVLDWGVLDKTTNAETDVGNGGSFTVMPGDTMLVTLRVKDPAGIKSMSIWADGEFQCQSKDRAWDAPSPLSAGVARSDTSLPSSADTNGFILSNEFVYDNLDCGVHIYANMTNRQDFLVFAGTLHFHGTETDASGVQTAATLDLAP